MKIRILLFSLLVSFLPGCDKSLETLIPGRSSAERASALEDATIGDRSVDPDDEVLPPAEIVDERERQAILLATLLPEPTCEQQPLATPFYALMGGNTRDCGRLDPKVVTTFNAFMEEAAASENPDPTIPPLSDRLLSGPSGPGKPYLVDGETWWYYTACQAHKCGTTHLEILYHPVQSKMVGRLINRCEVHWLGSPSTAKRKLIDAIDPVHPYAIAPKEFCEDSVPNRFATESSEAPAVVSEVDDMRVPQEEDVAGCEAGAWRKFNGWGEHEGGASYFGVACRVLVAGTRFKAHDAISGRAVCCFRVVGSELAEDDLRVGFHVSEGIVGDIFNYWSSDSVPRGLHVFELEKEGALESHSFEKSLQKVDESQLFYGGDGGGLLLPEDSEVVEANLLRVGMRRYRLQSVVEVLGDGAGVMELHTLSPENEGVEIRVEVPYGTEY